MNRSPRGNDWAIQDTQVFLEDLWHASPQANRFRP